MFDTHFRGLIFYFNDSTHLIHLRIPKHSLPIVKNVLGAKPQ